MRELADESQRGDVPQGNDGNEATLINEAQLLLAEKRTSLSTMRTGIAVMALPLSVVSLLIATSKHYDMAEVMSLILPLLALCGGLVLLGAFLIIRALVRIRNQDRMILELKRKHSRLGELINL